MAKAAAFFVHQTVIVSAEVKVTNNIFITVDPHSYVKLPANIETLLDVGTRGEIIEIGPKSLLLYFFPGTHGIRIHVDRTYFSSRFTATDDIWRG